MTIFSKINSMWWLTPVVLMCAAANAQFGSSVDFLKKQIEMEEPGRDRIVKIDDALKKALSGRLAEVTSGQLDDLIRTRETQCERAQMACVGPLPWLDTICAARKPVLGEAMVIALWAHLARVASSKSMQTALMQQVLNNCSRPKSSEAFLQGLKFMEAANRLNPSLESLVMDWIQKTWTPPPLLSVSDLNNLAGNLGRYNNKVPRPMDLSRLLARKLAPSIVNVKKLGPLEIDVFNSVIQTLVSSGDDKSALSLIEAPPIAKTITDRPEVFMASLEAICAVWYRSGQLARCDKLIESLRIKSKENPKSRVEIEFLALQVLHFRGKQEEIIPRAEKLLVLANRSRSELTPWIIFWTVISFRELGKFNEAESQLDRHVEMVKSSYQAMPWFKIMSDDVRVTILTGQKKYSEAKVLSDQTIAALKKTVRGPFVLSAWVYYDRLNLALASGDLVDTQKFHTELNNALQDLPAMSYLGDLAVALTSPKGTAAAKDAIERATKVLGADHPLIKQVRASRG